MVIYTHILPISALALALSLCALKFMHYFQLNSYKAAEHFPFARRNPSLYALSAIYSGVVLFALLMPKSISPAFVTLLSLSYALSFKPASRRITKKPLVFTPRVIRMLVTEGVLAVGLGAVAVAFVPYRFLPIAVAAAFLLCPWLCLAANLINSPIEWAIRERYTREAKSLLRAHPSLKVIGITGSYGKTGTKYYLTTILSEKYNVLMTPGSFNTPMGVVKTVREGLKPTTEVFVCEMGAKYVGDIKELCEIAEPTVGILTSIAPQHLETFGSIERIAETKLELCRYLEKKGGQAVVNLDSPLIKKNLPRGVITCGTDDSADFKIGNIRADRHGTSFTLTLSGGVSIELTVPLLGAHNVTNVALASVAALRLGLTPDEVRRGAARIRSAPHRLELIPRGKDIIIDDAYNSNPEGSSAALLALSLFSEHKILITPGMVELGDKSEHYNYIFGKKAAAVCDSIILVGEKQTEPIRRGVIDGGFDESRLHICQRVGDAIRLADTLTDAPKVILLENDLPDNY